MPSIVTKLLQKIEVVLVRPQHPGNVGGVARAMKNMGFSRMVLVDPCDYQAHEAHQMACGASAILDRARTAKTLPEALGKTRFVVGTSVRPRKGYDVLVPLPELVPEILSSAGRYRTALVFGAERTGLTNEEAGYCQRLGIIPTVPRSPSLNMAQAVIVVLYEILKGCEGKWPVPDRILASREVMERLYADLECLLREVGFLKGTQGGLIMATLRQIFNRAAMDAREVRVLRGIFRQVRWARKED